MVITCGSCDNTWGGVAQAHCSVCHELFSGVTSFDRHRSGGKCLKPGTMTNEEGIPVLELRTGGVAPVWAFPTDVDFVERFHGSKG